MVRQARSERTRATIIRAAAEMFERYGYGATSLSDVIAHAQVTRGAIYFHFASKEELAHAVMNEQHQMWMGQAAAFAQLEGPALERLIRMSYGLAGQLLENPVVRAGIRLTLENGTYHRPRPDLYLDWINVVEDLLQHAHGEGQVRAPVGLARSSQFIVSAFTGIQLVAQVIEQRQTLFGRVEEMWHMVLPGLVVSRKLSYYLAFASSAHKDALAACKEASTA
jgi:TetR/AcrR family transcriptional repressor of uid operon